MSILKTIRPGAGRPYVRKVSGKDGVEKQMRFIPVPLETGEILMTCWDITRKMEADQRTRERNLMLEVLNDIMASVGRSLRMSEILDTLKRVFAEKLKIHSGAVFLYSEGMGKSNMEMCWGVPDAARDAFETFALACYGAGKIIHVDDVTLLRNEIGPARSRDNRPVQEIQVSWLPLHLASRRRRDARHDIPCRSKTGQLHRRPGCLL